MLREQKESGLSVKEWCRERGLAEHIYCYQLRKFRQAACTALEQAQPMQCRWRKFRWLQNKKKAMPSFGCPSHSTEEACESRQRKGLGGHQETETAYQSVQKHITRKGVSARG